MSSPPVAVALALGLLLASGCVSRESLRTSFRSEINQCVGRKFMEPESWACRWSDAIKKRQVSPSTDEYEMAMDNLGRCRWIYTVERASRRVTGWRYASGADDCYLRIDWLGAW